ncbi:hypothetical protein [Pontivivens ytuae]|uniref:Lactate-binding periplasmic protein n=1 Tax=Pontivivens ytuae TaxID=2789856 RepID=A0A7S9LUL6_9RHOB|nr:hypothetical protein [Pontivivens ytuae]QPH55451.1 hypothetical protein I0K15_06870 [Pontivivens ytuae]
MDRRDFIRGSAGAGIAAAAAAPARAQSRQTLVVGTVFGLGATGRAAIGADFAESLSALTNGAVQISFEDLSGREAADVRLQLETGEVDGILGTEDLWFDVSPAYGLFAAVPGGLTERELEAWIRADTGSEVWAALSATHGKVPFLMGDSGATPLWSASALDDVSAFAGQSAATTGLAANVLARLGVTVQPTAAPSGFPARATLVQTGPLGEQYDDRQNALAYLYLDAPTCPSAAVSLNISEAAWGRLGDSAQRSVRAATTAVTYRANARAMQANALAHQALRLNASLTIGALPQPVWTAMMDASRAEYEALDALEGEAREAWRAYTRFGRAVQNWTRVSEAAFTEARARNLPA